MSKIISIHSFRGGTGKSNTTANLAALLALRGQRVGVIDTDIASPGIHVLFGLDDTGLGRSLNDYLWRRCSIEQTAHDVTASLGLPVPGRVLLIPSSLKAGEIARILREDYDVGLLSGRRCDAALRCVGQWERVGLTGYRCRLWLSFGEGRRDTTGRNRVLSAVNQRIL